MNFKTAALIFFLAMPFPISQAFQGVANWAHLSPPGVLTYATTPASYNKWDVVSNALTATGGGAVASYSITPTLPTGLSFNTSTGLISGTPSVSSSTTAYTITATNAAGTSTVNLNLTVSVLPYTWVGGSGTGWNTAANWSGNAVPSLAGHTAIFDNECNTNCAVNLNTNVTTLGSIRLLSSYTGTITQNLGITFTIKGLFYQAGGTFTGHASTPVSFDKFELAGGTFSAGQTTNIGWDNTSVNVSNTDGFIMTGGTFTHNNQTVYFNGSIKSSGVFRSAVTLDVVTSVTFYNLKIKMGDSYVIGGDNAYRGTLKIASGDKIVVVNDLTIEDGSIDGGEVDLYGNLVATCASDAVCADRYFTTLEANISKLNFVGAAAQTYSIATGAWVAGVVINKTNQTDTVSPVSTSPLSAAFFTLTRGTFTAPSSTLTVGYSNSTASSVPSATVGFIVGTGATYTHNSGTFALDMTTGHHSGSYSFIFDVDTSVQFYDVVLSLNDNYSNLDSGWAQIATGDTLVVNRDLTITNGRFLGGKIQLARNLTASCDSPTTPDICASGEGATSTTLEFIGSAAQQYTTAQGATVPWVIINKTNNTDTVDPAVGTTYFATPKIDIQKGTFKGPSGTFTVGYNLTSGTTLLSETDGFLVGSGASYLHNNGKVYVYCRRNQSNTAGAALLFNVDSTLDLYDLEVRVEDSYTTANGVTMAVTSGDQLVVNGTLTVNDGKLSGGTIVVKGNVAFNYTSADVLAESGGTSALTWSGMSMQSISVAPGAYFPEGPFIINKGGGSVNLTGNLVINGAGQNLTVTAGTLAMTSYNITLSNNFVNSDTVTCVGGGFITAGGTKTGAANPCY